jgi:hypothetical protein
MCNAGTRRDREHASPGVRSTRPGIPAQGLVGAMWPMASLALCRLGGARASATTALPSRSCRPCFPESVPFASPSDLVCGPLQLRKRKALGRAVRGLWVRGEVVPQAERSATPNAPVRDGPGPWRARCLGAHQTRRGERSWTGASPLVRMRILACLDCCLASHTRPLSTTPSTATPMRRPKDIRVCVIDTSRPAPAGAIRGDCAGGPSFESADHSAGRWWDRHRTHVGPVSGPSGLSPCWYGCHKHQNR